MVQGFGIWDQGGFWGQSLGFFPPAKEIRVYLNDKGYHE